MSFSPGDRVLCFLGVNSSTADFDILGFGTVDDIEEVPEGINPVFDVLRIIKGPMAMATVLLDSGDKIYSAECSFTEEEQGEYLIGGLKTVTVSIHALRQKAYAAYHHVQRCDAINKWAGKW